ncbi:MAG: hypothetical protein JOZ01_01970, partial [Candidatus Eremiobacteraeota bacterium]|nr:hypothetical protein [Candidatus Eremiobacteraeota bacterium]
MKPRSLIDAAGATALEFVWLAEAVKPASEYGLRIFAGAGPFVPGEEEAAQARARRIADCASALEVERLDAVRDALRTAPDVIGALARASMGSVLADADFFELAQFCDVAANVDALITGAPGFAPLHNRGVRELQAALAPGRAGSYQFYLADAFDAKLADSRALLERAQRDFERARDGV